MSVPGTKRTFSIGHLTAFDTYLLAMEAKHEVTRESLIEAEGLFQLTRFKSIPGFEY